MQVFFANQNASGYSPRDSNKIKGLIVVITPAYAQGAAAAPNPLLEFFVPMLLIVAIFYFLIMRPQRKRLEAHQKMVEGIRRGDTVVTSGGIVGKVTKVPENSEEIQVEISEGVRVRIMKNTLSDVKSKTEPVPPQSNDNSGKT